MKRAIRNSICRIDVIPEATGAASISRGTGFLVGPDLILTALHVVADRRTQPPTPYPGRIQLEFPGHKTAAAIHETNWDPKEDWVVLRCENPPPVAPLRLAKPPEQNCDWQTYGFPDANPRDGMVQTGSVETFEGSLDGAPVYQLYSKQAAAGKGAPVRGLSGGPVIIGQQVVGILRFALMKEGETVAGTLYGCPVERPAARLPELLKLQEPVPPTKWDAIDLKWRQHQRIVLGAVALLLASTIALSTQLLREKFVPAMFAVVPFRLKEAETTKMTPDLKDIHEPVAELLGKAKDIRMLSPGFTATLGGPGKPTDYGRLAAHKVDRVLEGVVFQSGRTLRLKLTLTDPQSLREVWTETIKLDGGAEEMPALVANTLFEGLNVRVPSDERARANANQSKVPEASAALRRGNKLLDMVQIVGTRTVLLSYNAQNALEMRDVKDEDFVDPIAAYRQAIAADPSFALARARLAQALALRINRYGLQEGLKEDAEAELRQIEGLKPDLVDVHIARGHLKYREAKYADALAHYRHARTLEPHNDRLALMTGMTQRRLGLIEESLASLELATRLNPAHWPAQVVMAEGLRQLRRYPQARDLISLVMKHAPPSAPPFIERAMQLATQTGDVEGANQVLRDALVQGVPVRDLRLALTLSPMLSRVLEQDVRNSLNNTSLAKEDEDLYVVPLVLSVLDETADFYQRKDWLERAQQIALELAERKKLPLEPWVSLRFAVGYASINDRTKALAALATSDALARKEMDATYQMLVEEGRVLVHLLLGDEAETLRLVESTIKPPSNYTAAWLKVDPHFARLRDHPDFVHHTRL